MSAATDILQRDYAGNMASIGVFQRFDFVEQVIAVGLVREGRKPLDICEESRYLNTRNEKRGKGSFREGEYNANATNTIA
jgi:hypothetical protein